MIIKDAEVFTLDEGFVKKDLIIRDGMILGDNVILGDGVILGDDRQLATDELALDGTGLKAIPELVDIHFHGCDGADFCDGTKEAIQKLTAYQLKNGIGAVCPATMTYDEATLCKIAEAAAEYTAEQNTCLFSMTASGEMAEASGTLRGADLVGIYMEGPFISYQKRGSQNGAYIHKPDGDMFLRIQDKSGGLFKLCALAPEEEGAMEFIRKVKDSVKVSVAHTCTDYDKAIDAFDQGACHVTHLYNAMPGINHREPGPIIAAWEKGATVELIADGIHIHPAVVKATFSLFGRDRVVLVSDSVRATGRPDGDYELGGQAITVMGSRAVLTDTPDIIAGSVTNLMDCLRKAVKSMGIPLEWAVQAAACNPARVLGIDDRYGQLQEGCYGNVLLVDDDLNIRYQIHHGKVVG